MTRHIILGALMLLSIGRTYGQSDEAQIRATIQQFIVGTEYNYPDSVASSFYPDTRMFLYTPADTVWTVSSDTYASWYGRREPGTRNARYSSLVSLDIVNTVAYAKVQVDIPSFGNRYSDLLLLKKLPEGWKIVAKATSAEPLPKTPQEWDSRPVQETVLWDLKKPWSMVFLSEEEALIAEKDGTILLVNLTTNSRTPLEGLPTDVGRAKEIDTLKYPGEFHPNLHGMTQSFNAGWFQLLLHPDFENEPYLYISYVAEDEERASALKVIRGKLEGNQLSDVETLLLAGPFTHGLFHYGGGMVFGRDGKLYITTGERNFYEYNNPPLPTAQNLADPRGKVFRLNPDGSIPKDNPDFGPEAVPGLYGLGIRAAQGLALHPATGDIWMSEHGTHQGDELNVLQGGGNYGWPYRTTGRYRTDDYDPQEPEGLEYVDPVHVWNQTVAPTGLAFYTGREFPQWQGDLLVPGLSQGNLWRIRLEGSTVVGQEELFVDQRTRLRKVILSPRGVLYLLTDEEEGRLIRVVNKNF